ncbi:hypothetical protein [Streptomyces sp. NPDC053048]|uniref:hypothetical protein n=1 Tax=Streptomyces sp. NPDC053048 TaxID=3365694 RepID=UPI0037D0CD37
MSSRERKVFYAAIAVLLSCVVALASAILKGYAGANLAECVIQGAAAFATSMTVTLAVIVYLTV